MFSTGESCSCRSSASGLACTSVWHGSGNRPCSCAMKQRRVFFSPGTCSGDFTSQEGRLPHSISLAAGCSAVSGSKPLCARIGFKPLKYVGMCRLSSSWNLVYGGGGSRCACKNISESNTGPVRFFVVFSSRDSMASSKGEWNLFSGKRGPGSPCPPWTHGLWEKGVLCSMEWAPQEPSFSTKRSHKGIVRWSLDGKE
jgi:hypothetical protein